MGQRERKIRHRLRRYAASCREICPEEKEKKIGELLEYLEKEYLQAEPPERTRGSLWDFVWEQIGYLGRYCLFWQAAWAILFFWLLRSGIPGVFEEGNGNEILLLFSLLPPLLVLLTVEEITKVYQRSMLEIEYATKYSLGSVVLVRMGLLCMAHSCMLAICILCIHSGRASSALPFFVYGFTPMIVMTGILLKLMQHCQGETLRWSAVFVYILTVVAVIGWKPYFAGLYEPEYLRTWGLICACGFGFALREFVTLCGRLTCFEEIVRYE